MESARERHVLLTRTAPHLVHPITQATPFTPQIDGKGARMLRVGLRLGDGLRRAAGTSRDATSRAPAARGPTRSSRSPPASTPPTCAAA